MVHQTALGNHNVLGIVDAAVSGGVKNYMNAFLSEEYVTSNTSEAKLIYKLIVQSQLFSFFTVLVISTRAEDCCKSCSRFPCDCCA